MQEVIVHLITDRVSIAIRRLDVICDESNSPLCQDSFARTGRDIIIRLDRILQVRCKNGIDIVSAIFDIVGTNLAIDINQSLRRTIDSYLGFTIIIAIGQASDSYSILESILDTLHFAISLLEATRRDGQICFVDFKVALRVDDFVVDTCITHEADIFHIDGIRIRSFVGISSRATGLIHGIGATGLDGQDIRAVIQLIAIDNRLARHAFLIAGERCGERPVVDGRIAIGLVAAAVDVDLASEDLDSAAVFCSCAGIAARSAFIRQVIAARGGFDVVNCLVIGFIGRCFIAARTRCGLCPAFARERAAAIVVVGYVAFVEGIRIFVDVMFVLILSNERCFSRGRDIVIRQFFAVDFRHVVSGDIDGRLYLEDVLVAIVLTCRIRSARRTPLCVRAAVEVRTELIGIWRVGIDLPVAARSSRDSILCLCCIRRVMEGTICTACIDNDGIICIRRGNQCATALGIIRQSDRTVTIRIGRDQANLITILDAMDRDIIHRFDGNKAIRCNLAIDSNIFICSRRGNLNLFVCGNLTHIHIALRGNLDVAICGVLSSIRVIVMDINGAKDFDIACRRLDGQVAQARAFAAAQASCIRHTFRAYGYIACTTIDGKCRVRQFRLTDKTMNRSCSIPYIVPAILVCPTNSNIRLASSPSIIIRLIIIWQIMLAGWHIAYPVGIHTILVCTRSYTICDIKDLIFFWPRHPRKLTSTYLRSRWVLSCLLAASKVLDDRTRNLPSRCHGSRVFIFIRNGYEMLTIQFLAIGV